MGTQSADGLEPVRNPNPSGPQPLRAGPLPSRAYVPQVPGTAHVSKRSAANEEFVPKVKNTQPTQSRDGLVPVRNPNPTQSTDGLVPVRNPNPSGPQPVRAGPLPVRTGPLPSRAYVPQVPGTAHVSKRSAANDDSAPVRNPNPNQSADGLVPVPNPNPSGPQPVRAGP